MFIQYIEYIALQRKSHLCIPKKGIARPQSKFPYSCFCERFLYSQEQSAYISCSRISWPMMGIYKSHTDEYDVEIRTEAAQFDFWEYINRIFFAVHFAWALTLILLWTFFICRGEKPGRRGGHGAQERRPNWRMNNYRWRFWQGYKANFFNEFQEFHWLNERSRVCIFYSFMTPKRFTRGSRLSCLWQREKHRFFEESTYRQYFKETVPWDSVPFVLSRIKNSKITLIGQAFLYFAHYETTPNALGPLLICKKHQIHNENQV